MTTSVKLAAFVAGLIVIFGAAFGVGRLVDPGPAEGESPAGHDAEHASLGAAGVVGEVWPVALFPTGGAMWSADFPPAAAAVRSQVTRYGSAPAPGTTTEGRPA